MNSTQAEISQQRALIQQADHQRLVEGIDDPSELGVTFGTVQPIAFETATVYGGAAGSAEYKWLRASGAF